MMALEVGQTVTCNLYKLGTHSAQVLEVDKSHSLVQLPAEVFSFPVFVANVDITHDQPT